MTDTANEATTMIGNLRTGGGSMTWGERARRVLVWLKLQEEDIKAILADSLATEGIKESCRRLAVAVGMIGVTVDMLAQVCEEKGRQQVPDEDRESRETRRELAAIDNLAMQLRRIRDEGDDTRDKCISAGIMAHVYELGSLLEIKE